MCLFRGGLGWNGFQMIPFFENVLTMFETASNSGYISPPVQPLEIPPKFKTCLTVIHPSKKILQKWNQKLLLFQVSLNEQSHSNRWYRGSPGQNIYKKIIINDIFCPKLLSRKISLWLHPLRFTQSMRLLLPAEWLCLSTVCSVEIKLCQHYGTM